MNINIRICKFILPSLTLFALFVAVWKFEPKTESAGQKNFGLTIENFDIRTDKTDESREKLKEFISNAQTADLYDRPVNEAEAELRQKIGSLNIERSETLNAPEVISAENGFLTQPKNDENSEILRSFLRQNSALFGLSKDRISALEISADYTNPDGNLSFVQLEEKLREVPVFQGEIKAGFTKRGEIVRIINNLTPNISENNVSENFGNPQDAVKNAAKYIGISADENDLKILVSENLKTTFERGQFSDRTTAEKFYFPVASGAVRPAWRVLLWTKNNAYYVIVDAQDGTLLWRKNITENQTLPATYNIYGNSESFLKTEDSPVPFTPGCFTPDPCLLTPIIPRQNFTLIGNEPPYTFNNLGWIADGENKTVGNAVEAGIDRDGVQGVDPNGWAFGDANRNFIFNYNPAPGNPEPGENPRPTTQTYPPSPFQQGSATHVFYMINRWHDEMYLLGFNEAARNFQTDNFGRGGGANDSISAETQDSSGTNGGNFSTPADGTRPRLQLFIWTGTTPNRDGALDSQIAIHEVTHGLTSRLHGNATGLSSNMSRGMGEGWSDFYSLALLSAPSDNRFGVYSLGCYSIFGLSNCYYGIRRFPVARKTVVGANGLPHNPFTFRYVNSDCNVLIGTTLTNPNSAYPRGTIGSLTCDQVLNIGEVWSSVLWEVRGFLIDAHGAEEGNRRALQYITDGMKLSPLNPTMLQSRDAIISAAQASHPEDALHVWRGFAVRGMGFSASIQNQGNGNNNTVVTEAFNLPNSLLRAKRADFDGDGKSDLSVFRPTEGNWYLNNSSSGFSVIKWGISTDIPVSADFDGDNKTDLGIFRPETDGNLPDFYILYTSNFTFTAYSFGLPTDIPVIEDYDGDEKADISVFRPVNNTFYVLQSSTGNVLTFSRNEPGFRPVAGDFDGDGRGDFVVYGNGQWRISKSTDNYQSGEIVFWGLNDDKLVPADYDGDGIDDIAVFRPNDGVWYIRKSSGGNLFVRFGISTDIPVPGDFDGDGIYDVAVYRNGVWYINNSTAGVSISQFGLNGDLPIPNRYFQ